MSDRAPYRVHDIERLPTSEPVSSWKITFARRDRELIDLNVDSVAFVDLDLDRDYAVGDLMILREEGSLLGSTEGWLFRD
jgi:hypothetical protein